MCEVLSMLPPMMKIYFLQENEVLPRAIDSYSGIFMLLACCRNQCIPSTEPNRYRVNGCSSPGNMRPYSSDLWIFLKETVSPNLIGRVSI